MTLDASIFPILQELSCSNQSVNNWEPSKNFTVSSINKINKSDSDSAKIINLKAWDSSGNSIAAQYNSATSEFVFDKTPAKFSYDYVTGFENILMDVTVYSDSSAYNDDEQNETESESEFSQNGGGSGGGGCNSGLNILCLVLCLAALNRKR